MEARELNQRLVAALPGLEQKYRDTVSWQDGDETGSHVVYGDVLAPAIETLLAHGDFGLARKYFDYLENLLALDDSYAEEVVALSVIEYLYYGTLHRAAVKAQLGGRCRKLWEDFETYDKGIAPTPGEGDDHAQGRR